MEHSAEKPLNREPPVEKLVSSFITTEEGYDRNHGPTPHLDIESHRVVVDGAVIAPLELSLLDLQSFPQHTVTCALQCAGNRRHTMRTLLKEVDGIDWGDGAVMNCQWRGPLLRDVLLRSGLKQEISQTVHVAFACHQVQCQDDSWYGASVELWRAMALDREIVLAIEMNGKALPMNHGAPVRVVVPGVAGARSVKWLDRVTVQEGESQNHYQRKDYKILPPEVTNKEEAEKYWDITPALQDMPINSVVASPKTGETVVLKSNSTVEVRGYALPQGPDGPVVKVEISTDDGKIWQEADLLNDEIRGKWCWLLWRKFVIVEPGQNRRILSKATDKGENTQESTTLWNLRGVGYNGYGESRDLTFLLK